MTQRLILASQSPRRRELLAQVGVAFAVAGVAVDERRHSGEAPGAYVERLARAKARAGAGRVASDEVVMGADTAVVADGDILGKPAHEADALAVLARLSGRSHTVCTGVAALVGTRVDTCVATSQVTLRPTSATERRAYWHSGEPQGKAGGYAIQGLGAAFVEGLTGSYSNVVGLPLFETLALLRGFGIDPLFERAPSWLPA